MLIAVSATAALILAGCGSGPAPRAEMGAAEQAVSQARAAQAGQYAPAELRQAETKLEDAKAAVERDDNTRARHLAEQAQIDAEIAGARSERERNQAASNEMRRGLESLRDQAEQGRRPQPPMQRPSANDSGGFQSAPAAAPSRR